MAIDLTKIKPNIPKVDLSEYSFVLAGIPKSGKTTLFAKIVEKYLGDISKGLLIAFEKGYTALKVNAVDVEAWDDFEDLVDQLVERKDELPFKFLGIDTADIMWELVQEAVIEEWNRQNPTLRAKDINAVGMKKAGGQGYGVGYNRAKAKIRKQIDRLQKAGYGMVIITHSKDDKVEEKSGLEYNRLILSLPSSAREVFVNMADFINFITIEKEKVGDEIVTKRYIYFRSDGYVEAGGRFTELPERIEYDVEHYIETIENAIQASLEEGTDVNKLRKKQQKEREEQAKKFVEKEKLLASRDLDEIVDEVKSLVNEGNKNEFIKRLKKEVGVSKPSELDTKEKAFKALEIIKSIETEG